MIVKIIDLYEKLKNKLSNMRKYFYFIIIFCEKNLFLITQKNFFSEKKSSKKTFDHIF